jgi:hypothetical protein
MISIKYKYWAPMKGYIIRLWMKMGKINHIIILGFKQIFKWCENSVSQSSLASSYTQSFENYCCFCKCPWLKLWWNMCKRKDFKNM